LSFTTRLVCFYTIISGVEVRDHISGLKSTSYT
jgi:hypothetical protein